MAYSIIPVLHPHENKQGLHKINIQVIYQRKKAYVPTIIKVPKNNFKEFTIVNLPNRNTLNGELKGNINEIEKRLLDAIRINPNLSKQDFDQIVKGQKTVADKIVDYLYELVEQLAGKLSKGRLQHYRVMAVKVEQFAPGLKFNQLNIEWLQRFEAHLRKSGNEGNTIVSNMSLLKGVLNKARVAGLIDREKFEDYKVPRYTQKMPEYMNEQDLAKLYDFLQVIEKPGHKLAGYYFLLSAYAGYRVSDLKTFDYNTMVMSERIRLRAKKNGQIVSIIIHTRLAKVLEYIKDKPLYLSEQKVREYVKELCSYIGIKPKKLHDARHSFAMMLAENGFSLDEAASLLGDTTNVAKVYFRMTNKRIDDKIKDRLG